MPLKLWQQKLLTFLAVAFFSFLLDWLSPVWLGQYVFLTIFVLGTIGSWEMTEKFWPSVRRWFRTNLGF